MQNFNWTSFTKRIAVRQNLEVIYNAWTIPNEIEKWFLKTALFYRSDGNVINGQERIKEEDTYKWIWYLYQETESGKIIELNGTDFMRFTFAGNCLVDIKLLRDGEYTIVELTQHNIPTDDHSKQYIRIGCASGWSFYLTNLKSVYEGGIDLRNKEERLQPMINN